MSANINSCWSFGKLVNNCSQFLRKCSFFLLIFQMIYINVWMLHLGTNFSWKGMGLQRLNDDLLTWEIKLKKHTWNIDPFRWTPLNIKKNKQTNWVWKMHAFRLVNIVAFTALVQLNNLYNNRFFNAYSMGCLSLTLCFIDTMVITDWATNF